MSQLTLGELAAPPVEPRRRSRAPPDNDAFNSDCLDSHNACRQLHQSPPLRWAADLADQAQAWADKLAQKRFLTYSELPGVGENITFFPANFTGQQVVEYWMKEEARYDFEVPGWQAGSNYFTQIIWKSTSELAVGRALTDDETPQCVVVAFYRPMGNSNRPGDFPLNVFDKRRVSNGAADHSS